MIFARNLFRNKARTLITIVGISVGVATYVATSAVVGCLTRLAEDVIAGFETDIAVQSQGAANPMVSRVSAGEVEDLKQIFGSDATPLVVGTLREKWNAYALVLGTTTGMINRFGLISGRGLRPGAKEAVIGSALSARLGLGLGSLLPLAGGHRKVVGTYSIGNRTIDNAVVLDLEDGQQLLHLDRTANVVVVHAGRRGDPRQIAQQINTKFPRLLAVASDDFLRGLRIFKTIETFVKAVGAIAFLACVLFVTNALLHSLSERTREIGILMAVGWSPIRILRMLFAEGLLLSLLGAGLGNGLGVLMLRLIGRSRVVGFGWLPMSVPFESVVLSLGLVLAVAVVSCLWPAVIVFRFSPVQALRHE
ncbi:MAG: ABC transporter permease [Pseudomonadota bacterium]